MIRSTMRWVVLLLLVAAQGYSLRSMYTKLFDLRTYPERMKYFVLFESQRDSSEGISEINDMELIYGGSNVSLPVTFGDFINRSLYWTSDWDINASVKISTSKIEGLGLQQLEKHVVHNVPTVRTWIDPESPENLKKFTEDISTIGTQHGRIISKINSSNHSVGLKVMGVKNSWKKGNFRSNQRTNLSTRQIAEENNVQLHMENVEQLVVTDLSQQLLAMASNEFKRNFIADKTTQHSKLHQLVLQLFQAKREYLGLLDSDFMQQLTSTLFRLCEKKKYYDVLSILIEATLYVTHEDLLGANLGSLYRVFSSLYAQRKHETICKLYSLALHLYLIKKYNETQAVHSNTLIEIGSLSRLRINMRFNILETLFQFQDSYLTSKNGELFITKIIEVYGSQRAIDASLYLFNKLITRNITIGSTVVEALAHQFLDINQVDVSFGLAKLLHNRLYIAKKEYYVLLIDKLMDIIDSSTVVSSVDTSPRQTNENENKLLMLVTDLHKLRDVNIDTVSSVIQIVKEKLDGRSDNTNLIIPSILHK